jgi:hypothetical protein
MALNKWIYRNACTAERMRNKIRRDGHLNGTRFGLILRKRFFAPAILIASAFRGG